MANTKKYDTHGIEISNLLEVSNLTRGAGKYGRSSYYQIAYVKDEGRLIAEYFPDRNSWVTWNNPDIVNVCNASGYISPQNLADKVAWTLGAIEDE